MSSANLTLLQDLVMGSFLLQAKRFGEGISLYVTSFFFFFQMRKQYYLIYYYYLGGPLTSGGLRRWPKWSTGLAGTDNTIRFINSIKKYRETYK